MAVGSAIAAPMPYTTVDLGRGYSSEVRDIYNTTYVGNVGVGSSSTAAMFFTTQDRVLLPRSANDNGQATGVTPSGLIVGYSEIDAASAFVDTFKHAVRWSGGVRLRYDEPAGATNSYARSVNHAGVAAGTWDTLAAGVSSNSNVHAARWNANGTVVDLSTAGEVQSVASAINNSGVIAGYRRFATGPTQAVVWGADNVPVVLPGLGTGTNRALVINDIGIVAGVSDNGSGVLMPFYYDGATHALPGVAGATSYSINDINSAGQIVGSALVAGTTIPLLWDGGQVYDLQTLTTPYTSPTYGTITLREAFTIDDAGNIGVNGDTPNPFAATRAVLLTVPEPSSLLLLLIGPVVLCRRRIGGTPRR